jgi:hypothetical protein
MLTIEVKDRITIDEILETLGDADYCVQQVLEAEK